MKRIKSLLMVVLVAFVVFAAVGCKQDKSGVGRYTYNTFTTVSPSNWNELTYRDNNDRQILSYIASNFFEYDFKFDSEGKPISGEFDIEYSAATKLEDVSSQYAGADYPYGIAEGESGRAYKITLRNDLKWDDGTAIKADDFVYSMKEQLNPLFQNFRADSYYVGSTVIFNAEEYVKQGSTIYVDNCTVASNPASCEIGIADLVKNSDGVYKLANGKDAVFAIKSALIYLGGGTLNQYKDDLGAEAYEAFAALADSKGYVAITDESIALLSQAINVEDWGFEGPECVPCYIKFEREYPELDFSNVGIFKGSNDYELIIVLKKSLELLDANGNMTFKAAYNMASLPLVKRSLYESCKIAPASGSTLWTSNYNSSAETTASWGPYKLQSFQSGKSYVLVKNDNWYGYNIEQYKGQYQTTRIVCETIAEFNTSWLKFQAGELDDIGIDVTIADDYKSSPYAYYTPSDFVASLQIQSDVEALKARESEGINKTILANVNFRKALSLSINRADFAAKTTTSSKAGFGLFNSMHYYDVEHSGVYRKEDCAKQVLCEIYDVDVSQYESLDAAAESITGYDLATARELVDIAYNEELAAGNISATDKVELTFGSSIINEVVTRRHTYIKNAWKTLVQGTALEGRLQFSEDVAKGEPWAEEFRGGSYDICLAGWSGAAWDPGYFLLAYLANPYMYSAAWDTSSVEMTFTMPGVGPDGADVTDTLSLLDWYNCLNNGEGAKYTWGEGNIPAEKRLLLIAALEKEILSVYYTVPLYNTYTASLFSQKTNLFTLEYNTFMEYGGIRYMTYNFDDYDWAKYVKKHKGKLEYK